MKRFASAAIAVLLMINMSSCVYTLNNDDLGEPDKKAEEDKSVYIRKLSFDGRKYIYEGASDDIMANGNTITIRAAGDYLVGGELIDGSLMIEVKSHETVRLILDGVSISSSKSVPIKVNSAACVILELATDSVNILSRLSSIPLKDKISLYPDACIESICNIIVTGNGSLAINSRADAAISCLGRVDISGGKMTVSSAGNGIWVRDRFVMSGGALSISTAKIGILADDAASSEGRIEINEGRLTASCSDAVLKAGRNICISGGVGSFDSKVSYICERAEGDNIISGEIEITSPQFPKN